jgi:hypothetical protein
MRAVAEFLSLQSAAETPDTPMKILATFTVAALLTAGSAFAASTPTATPATATPTTKHHTAMHCEKEAKAKKLSGADEKRFVKDCREGKKAA